MEKLAKAVEGLKNIQFISTVDEVNISKKEKMFLCVLAADIVVSHKGTTLQNLPVIIENMIDLCDDKDSDVRMVADESLNRIIMATSESSMFKILVELHKVIKKNGPARCVRAALNRFGQISHHIKPSKGKAHAQTLIPSLIEITKRQEEIIHECLASCFVNIFKVLGVYVQDNSLKSLIKAFLHNLSSPNPVIRRCSASCIISTVQYCRKPHIFNSYVLNSLLDCVVPIVEDNSIDLVLGVLGALRLLLPALTCVRNDEGISGSFGLRRKQDESVVCVDRLIQTYELCLHYTNNKDHNVVTAALETLNQILQNPHKQLEFFFLSPAGFSRSYIHSAKENKLWSRSGSEMSVACSLPPLDELLLDDNDISSQFSILGSDEGFESKHSTPKSKEKFDFSEEDKILDNPFQDKTLGNQSTLDIDSDAESTAASDVNVPANFLMRLETEDKNSDVLEKSRSNSQDELYTPSEGDSCHGLTASPINVGSFTDTAVPLIFCTRHLAASFLLDGTPNCLKSDRAVRVSIKSLALSCISAIIKLYPVVMRMNLSKNITDVVVQQISDIFLYRDHSDPQIRGCVNTLAGFFINSVLLKFKGFTSDWVNNEDSSLGFKRLLDIILKGLQDSSSVCARQALTAFKTCICNGLFSLYNASFIPLLEYLPVLSDSSYWLVKVKLVEVLSELPYICINDLFKSNAYQEDVINFVLLPLLGDEDSRVRSATAEAVTKIIRVLYYGKSTVTDFAKPFTGHLNKWLKGRTVISSCSTLCPVFSSLLNDPEEIDFDQKIDVSLSKIVSKLTYVLLVPNNKHLVFGCLEALKLLSQNYPPTLYSKGWNCSKKKTENQEDNFLTSNLITNVLSLLITSPLILDLVAFTNATYLLGNLFAGISIPHLRKGYQVSSNDPGEEPVKLWDVFTNERVSATAEEMLTHLLKTMNILSSLVEETTLSNVSESSVTASTLLSLRSPIKKPEKKPEEKPTEKKPKSVHVQKQTSQYEKLRNLLKNAFTNYKVSLDASAGSKFLDLLESNLYALSILLEVATVAETGRCAEEILSYLRAVVSLRSSPTVVCVIQLLKSLFGTNLASNWEDKKLPFLNFHGVHLFDSLFHFPTEFLSEKIRRRSNINSFDCENFTLLNRRTERKKVIAKNTDKNCLAMYIRLFEPIVVKALQLYTITGNVELQFNVLRLLNHLVELRVNYCLLDAKQIFVGFVFTQFEYIEHGQIPEVEKLLPYIFKFLILLSYEKQHSKPIIGIPKIMQLCDGLMASDQSIQTHCIPALGPVVEHIFLSRNLGSSLDEKELETQREVLLSMLLRLAEFPQVMDLLALVLNECKTVEEKEKWKNWSRQVIDAVLPLASQDRLRIETIEGQNSLIKLMSSLSLNVFRPIDPFLKVLFVEPNDYNCSTSLNRWLSKVTVLLETILFLKEDALLNRLEEISPNINLATFLPTGNLCLPDPFNIESVFQAYESSETAARFILKVVCVIVSKISECVSSSVPLQQKLSMFFVCVYHILKSGVFHRITNALQNLLVKEQETMTALCDLFKKIMHTCPFLTCQFSYFLALLSYTNNRQYWGDVLGKASTLSGKVVRDCGVIALSDYLCDNLSDFDTLRYLLVNNTEELILFSHEIPVKELLITIQRRKSDWSLLTSTIASRNFQRSQPFFTEKLLRVLEISDSSHSGAVLVLLITEFLGSSRLALSLLAGSVACRQVEYLLTLPKEKIFEQISHQSLDNLINIFKGKKYLKRHLTLWNLLNKLSDKIVDSPGIEKKDIQIEIENLKNVHLNEDWYFNRIKERCFGKESAFSELPPLLSKLSYERIVEIMSSPNFNLKILKCCLRNCDPLRDKYEAKDDCDLNNKSPNPLQEASKFCLLKRIAEVCKNTQEGAKAVYQKESLCAELWEVASCLAVFMENVFSKNLDIENEHLENVSELALLCLEVIQCYVKDKKNGERELVYPENLENGLTCCSLVIKSPKVASLLSEPKKREKLLRLIDIIAFVVRHLIPPFRFFKISKTNDPNTDNDIMQLDFLLDFTTRESDNKFLPKYLMNCLRNLVVNVCRVPVINERVLKVPESCDFQDIELLESFIFRSSMTGWSKRQHFEEIWVALLSVLGCNSLQDPLEENGFVVQAIALAVDGITTLLKSTMLDFANNKLIHHGRDSLSMKDNFKKLPLLKNAYTNDTFADRTYHFLDNLEMPLDCERYFYGLLSVEYLWTAVKQINSQVELYEKHSKDVSSIGLDLPSCVYLLTELYNQWIHQSYPDVKIVTSCLKSSIVISDLFTDVAQFQWMLNFSFRAYETVIADDTVILPLIILASSKAGAIVLPTADVCEKIKKLMLRSSSLPCRLATARGLLYLLQSYIVCYTVNHTAVPPAGSTFQAEEANFVANIVETFLPVALDVVQEFQLQEKPTTQDYDCCHWSLIFYLLQHYQSSIGSLKDELLNFILSTLNNKNCSNTITGLLIRGVQRLLLTTVVDEGFRDQLSKISLEIISHNSFSVARQGLQLLTILSFLDKRVKDIRQLVMGQEDPEKVMKDMEKINVLFDKLKKSYPEEAEIIGNVTSYVLADFSASDVLTKVIQEFLSSQQPHQKILSGLLFKVFERAELSLLEDWVVFSLSSFIQGLPIGMSIWILNCFFVSATNQPWLRALFPLVRSRIRMAESEDQQLLYLSSTHFYKQLKDESQRKSFMKTFEKAAVIDDVFLNLLQFLRSQDTNA